MKNKSAFPWTEDLDSLSRIVEHRGLTKREYCAIKAMQGLVTLITEVDDFHYEAVARESVRHADALLAELAKEES